MNKKVFSLLFLSFYLTGCASFEKESSFASSILDTSKEEIKVKVTYDPKEGILDKTEEYFIYGEPFTLPTPKIEEECHSFLGWYYLDEKIESSSYFPFKDDITLIAKYKDDTFSYSLNEDDTYTLLSYNGKERKISLPDEYLGKQVTRIGKDAFYCSSLEEVSIPSSYKILKEGCFSCCSSLKEISLPTTLEKMEADSFYLDENLKKVYFQGDIDSYLDIEYEEYGSPFSYYADFYLNDSLLEEVVLDKETNPYSFSHVSSLKKVTLKTKEIKENSFSYCRNLKEVKLEDIRLIQDYAFYECTSLESLSFPSSLRSISDYAFSKCYSLKNISFNEGLISLSSYCFSEDRKIQNLFLPSSLKEIKDHCFSGCTSLLSFKGGKNLTSIGVGSFSTCVSINALEIDFENPVYQSYGNGIYYKENFDTLLFGCNATIKKEGIKTIGREAFFGSSIKEYDFPYSLERIEDYAFSNTDLKEIHFKKNLVYLGKNVFTGASEIEKIEVDEENDVYSSSLNCLLNKEGDVLLYGCKGSLLKEGIKEIKEEAFYFSNIEEVCFPSSLRSIGERAFANCYQLKKVTSKDGLLSLGESVFSTCFSLKEVFLPSTLKEIPSYTFEKCTFLNKVECQGIEKICYSSFYLCQSLREFSLPSSLREIEAGSFISCEQLSYIDTSNNSFYTFKEKGLYDKKEENLFFGSNLFEECLKTTKNILEYAFFDSYIPEIRLNEGLEKIMDYAFYSSDLESISFPSSIKYIGMESFSYTKELREVSFDLDQYQFQKVFLSDYSFIESKATVFHLQDKTMKIPNKYKYY